MGTAAWILDAYHREFPASAKESSYVMVIDGIDVAPVICTTGPWFDCNTEIIAAWCQRPDGTRDGPYLEWHELVTHHDRPRRALEGQYENGREQGVWVQYYETGAVSRRETYLDGVLLESKSFELVEHVPK